MADVFYNKTVTVFNCYTDDLMGNEIWLPTLLEDVRLLEADKITVATGNIAEADNARLFIRTDNLPKPYVGPVQWSNLVDKEAAFTLCQDKDFFVVGNMLGEDTTQDDFLEYMKSKYDGVYQITNVDKFEIIPHLEVGGR